ncbi:MAG: cytochrome c oxidase accessory protein CcoG [Pseudomonadota bacterium]
MDTAVKKVNEGLYRTEAKIYPRDVKGRYARLRRLAMFVLLGIFYVGPFLRWDDRQAVLFDLPARKFHIFSVTLWPQDFLLLALLLIIAGVSLFFFTALAGRLWCGYACPQTVWTEAFVWIERAFEGDRMKRMKLDRAPWNFNKIWRKTGKQVAWIALALFTGFCFVGYFTPVGELYTQIVTGTIGGWATFWVLFYGFATYGNAGFMREQVCKYMCPYARFQSAMFDKDTLIVTYDQARGEPRGGRSRKNPAAAKGLGDCTDCTLCVQVCPTGIDIREGLQYECIACAACVDACNVVMDKMGYERGLIRYTTEHALEGRTTKVLRPRMFMYAAVLGALLSVFMYSLINKPAVIVDVIKDRNALYRDIGLRGIENTYTLHLINKTNERQQLALSVEGLPGIEISTETTVTIEPETSYKLPVAVTAPHESAVGGQNITFVVESINNNKINTREESRFRGPDGNTL